MTEVSKDFLTDCNVHSSMNKPVAEEPPGPFFFEKESDTYISGSFVSFPLTSVRPQQDIVLVWVAPTFEEVKEHMTSSDVDISRVRAETISVSSPPGLNV